MREEYGPLLIWPEWRREALECRGPGIDGGGVLLPNDQLVAARAAVAAVAAGSLRETLGDARDGVHVWMRNGRVGIIGRGSYEVTWGGVFAPADVWETVLSHAIADLADATARDTSPEVQTPLDYALSRVRRI